MRFVKKTYKLIMPTTEALTVHTDAVVKDSDTLPQEG